MKKQKELTPGEELLKQAVEECLEEDLSFVPPERELGRTHRFSESFDRSMGELLERTDSRKEQQIQSHFSVKFGNLAACVLILAVCGWIFAVLIRQNTEYGSSDNSAADTAEETIAEEEAASEKPAETAAAGAADEARETVEAAADKGSLETAEEESAAQEDGAAFSAGSGDAGAALKEEAAYCGRTVKLSARQEVPVTLSYVTTLVNCPVQDEDNPVLSLTIGNTGEEPLEYSNQYALEVRIEGGWYAVAELTAGTETQTAQWLPLEPGMAVDVELDLTSLNLDYEAGKYRLITYVNEEAISAEFTFSEIFKEMTW